MQRKTPPPPNIKKKPPINIPKPPTMLPTVVREQNQHEEGRQQNQVSQVPNVQEIRSQLTVGQQRSIMQQQQVQQNLVREQQNQFNNNQSSITNQNEQKPSISNALQQQQLPSNAIQHQQDTQNQLTIKPPAPPVQKNKIPPPSGMNKKTPTTNPLKRVGPPKLPTPIMNSKANDLQEGQKNIVQQQNNKDNENFQSGPAAGGLQPTPLILKNENNEAKLANTQIEAKNQSRVQVKNQVPKGKVPQKPKNQSIPIPIKKNLPPFQKTSLPSPIKTQQPKTQQPIIQTQQQTSQNPPILTTQPPPIQPVKTKPSPTSQQQTLQTTTTQPPSLSSPSSQYSQLQQKLKKLQLLRSQINQSSQQEQYQEQEDNYIEQQQQNQRDSLEGDMQRQNFQENRNNENVNIVQYQNQNEQQRRQQSQPQPQMKQEFRIEQTNYQDMEIKDYVEENYYIEKNQNMKLQVQMNNNQNNQQTSQKQPNNNPIPYLQTVYQSNIATQQTQHRYLPDQISNSLQKSQNRAIYDDLQKRQNLNQLKRSNNVEHANKYHSLANFATQQKAQELEEEERKAIQQFRVKQEKSDIQFVRNHLQQENHVNDTHQKQKPSQNYSLQMIHQKDTKSLNSQSLYQANKQNILTLPSILQTSPQNQQKTIQQLLQEFKSKKSLYQTNMQNLKRIQQKQKIQQLKYQEKIRKLVDEINHKNLVILRNAHLVNSTQNFILNPTKYDKNEINVNQNYEKKFVQVQQL